MSEILFMMFLILGTASTAYAITCYSCSTLTDSKCADPFSPDGTRQEEVCDKPIKICTKTKTTGTTINFIVRGCGQPGATYNNTCITVTVKDQITESCPCGHDRCNSSVSVKSLFPTTTVLSALALLKRVAC